MQHRRVHAVACGCLFDQRFVFVGFAAGGGARDARLAGARRTAGGKPRAALAASAVVAAWSAAAKSVLALWLVGALGGGARGHQAAGGDLAADSISACSCCTRWAIASSPAGEPAWPGQRLGAHALAPARSASTAISSSTPSSRRARLAVVLAAVALSEAVEHLVLAGRGRQLGVALGDLRLALLELARAQAALRLDALEEGLAAEQIGRR